GIGSSAGGSFSGVEDAVSQKTASATPPATTRDAQNAARRQDMRCSLLGLAEEREGILADVLPRRQGAERRERHAAQAGPENTVVDQDVAPNRRPDCLTQHILVEMIGFH